MSGAQCVPAFVTLVMRPKCKAVLIRTAAFTFCASALWALLPLQARTKLGLGAVGYGVLLGCLGTGALLGAGFLARARKKSQNNILVVAAKCFVCSSEFGSCSFRIYFAYRRGDVACWSLVDCLCVEL